MRMKRTVSFLLVLVMLLGLFAGCAQQGGETQPGTESQAGQETTQVPTEPEVKDPPRTAEDFIAQLSNALAARGMLVELVFLQENDFDADSFRKAEHRSDYYVYSVDKNETWMDLGISLQLFTEIGSEPLKEIQIHALKGAPQQGLELYPVLCGVASALCDEQMTEEKAAELFATEPYKASYVTYHNDIGSFTCVEEYIREYYDFGTYSVVFCQPHDLTHSLVQVDGIEGQCYKINFTEEDTELYTSNGSNETSLSLGELETFINGFFTEREIPIECVFQMQGRQDSYSCYADGTIASGNSGTVRWEARFRFTTLDDPDFVYPYVDLEYYQGDEMEKHRNFTLNENIPVSITVETKGFSYDASIFSVRCGVFSDYYYETAPGEDVWYDWAQQMIGGLGELWSAETEDNTVVNFVSEELAKGLSPLESEIDTDELRAWLYVWETGMSLDIMHDAINGWEYPEPEEMDTALLDCPFAFDRPVVQNGLFFGKDVIGNYHYRMDPYGMDHAATSVGDYNPLLAEYMGMSAAKITLRNYWYGEQIWFSQTDAQVVNGFAVGRIGAVTDEVLDYRYFGIFYHDVADLYEQMFMVYYNPKVDYPVEYEQVLRVPIGTSQIFDEGLTVEEAIALHTQPREMALTFGDWQLSYYAPREVAHIHCENTVTGQILYFVLPQVIFETYFETLEAFSENAMTIERYELLLDRGWLEKLNSR